MSNVNTKFVRFCMFSFCDLAGAERAKDTQNVGERHFSKCLWKMSNDNQMCRGKKLIPSRDSELTRLFQRALNGKECLAIIVNVNPTSLLHGETFNVLMFSAIAKQIILLPTTHKR